MQVDAWMFEMSFAWGTGRNGRVFKMNLYQNRVIELGFVYH